MEKITTIVFYTSNQEKENFQTYILTSLIIDSESMNIPLITVSQKPLKNCKNICVGDIGVSTQSILKQMLIGCEQSKTPFVTFAEADTLYPPDYFCYPAEDINKRYWFEPVYVLYHNKDAFYLKGRSDCGHMAGRLYVISLLKEALKKGKMMEYRGEYRPTKVEIEIPIINIKTGNGMNQKTQTSSVPVLSLPEWGKASVLRKELFGI
jgi:hypothetical protein